MISPEEVIIAKLKRTRYWNYVNKLLNAPDTECPRFDMRLQLAVNLQLSIPEQCTLGGMMKKRCQRHTQTQCAYCKEKLDRILVERNVD